MLRHPEQLHARHQLGTAGDAGGACGCRLNNCTLSGNWATNSGGGTYSGTLINCTITGNSAPIGGAAYGSGLYNCIAYYNRDLNGTNADNYCYFTYSCTTPLPINGIGNFTNAPMFVDYANGNLRLQSSSPCINAGHNAFAPAGPDLDGNPRIVGGTVDIGAYEFQSPQSRIAYAWLQQYGLPTDGSADYTDADGDGFNNWQEWRAGTNPTNALSALRLLSLAPGAPGAPGLVVRWQSVSARNYFLERSTNLGASPDFFRIATNIAGQPRKTSFTDTNAIGAGPFFYRVGVQD
jgi:hypothetical protein